MNEKVACRLPRLTASLNLIVRWPPRKEANSCIVAILLAILSVVPTVSLAGPIADEFRSGYGGVAWGTTLVDLVRKSQMGSISLRSTAGRAGLPAAERRAFSEVSLVRAPQLNSGSVRRTKLRQLP